MIRLLTFLLFCGTGALVAGPTATPVPTPRPTATATPVPEAPLSKQAVTVGARVSFYQVGRTITLLDGKTVVIPKGTTGTVTSNSNPFFVEVTFFDKYTVLLPPASLTAGP